MSPAPERKLKQALLPFNKKRKLEGEVTEDDTKCKKTCHNTASEVKDKSDVHKRQKVANDKNVTKKQEESLDKSKSCPFPLNDQKPENKMDVLGTNEENEKMEIDVSKETKIDSSLSDNGVNNKSSESNLTENLKTTVPISSSECDGNNVGNMSSTNSANVSITEETKSIVPESLIKNNGSEPLHSNTDTIENESVKDNSADKNVTPKRLTPKQLEKRREAELKRLERERQKQEKEQKKQELKEQKEKKRLAELEIKNAEKKQKEEERRQKEEERRIKEEERKAKEEERKAKEEERRQKALAKEEERKQKEEERRQKEEERKQKEEEKRQREEYEKKQKEKSAAIFNNFFLRNKTTPTNVKAESNSQPQNTIFMPFQIKDDMKLAPVNRSTLTPEMKQSLDEALNEKQGMSKDFLYLAILKSGNYKPGHSEDTWPVNSNDDDDDNICVKYERLRQNRPKLLQFGENRRPAYWGTWRKRSKSINPRRPWAQDKVYFDYDFDSDDEWVEEEPGESLHGSDDEKESEDEYEVDNDVFVPHGYLSDEEGGNDEDVAERSPKSQKLKLNLLEKEFEAEMKEKTRKLTARVFGCKWISNDVVDKDQTSDDVENLLLSFRAVWDDTRSPFHPKTESESITPQSTPSVKAKLRSDFPDSLLPCLIKLVHGNKNSASKLADEFSLYVLNQEATFKLSKTCIITKIREISSWVPNIACWIVTEEVRNQHSLGELSHQENSWKYVSNIEMNNLSKKSKLPIVEKQAINPAVPVVTTPTTSSQKSDTISIAKFLKVLTPEEKQKQLIASAAEKKTEVRPSSSSILNYVIDEIKKEPTSTNVPVKKRAILFTLDKKSPRKLSNISKISTDTKTSFNETVSTVTDLTSDDSESIKKIVASDKVLTENTVVADLEDGPKQNDIVCSSKNMKATLQSSSHKKEGNEESTTESNISLPHRSAVDVCSNLNNKPIEKSVNLQSSINVNELNNPKSPRTNENIARIQHGKKYAKLFTIGKVNKE